NIMPHYWLLLRLKAHGKHPVTHNEMISIRTYFDENPEDDSDLQKQGKQFVVPTERAGIVTNKNDDRLWLAITEAEYSAKLYKLFVWAEPYAIAAFSSPGAIEGAEAVGRITLTQTNEKYRGSASGAGQLHASVKAEDLVITHDIFLANSVVQFIV